MRRIQVLVVDDEPQIRRSVLVSLEGRGYAVSIATDGAQALQAIDVSPPDAIVLDLLLPDMDGFDVIRRIRAQTDIPIVIVSSLDTDQHRLEAFEQGVDDFVTKPFGISNLVSRLEAALERRTRHEGPVSAPLRFGSLLLDFERRELQRDGVPVALTSKEYELLVFMIAHRGRVLTHRYLLTSVWGPDFLDQARYVRVFVGQLRRKIEDHPAQPRFILSEPGVGYRFALT